MCNIIDKNIVSSKNVAGHRPIPYHITQSDQSSVFLYCSGFFNDLQPWNGYYTGYAQRNGTGAPRYKNGYAQSDGLGDRWKYPTAVTSAVLINNDQGEEVRIPFRPGKYRLFLTCWLAHGRILQDFVGGVGARS